MVQPAMRRTTNITGEHHDEGLDEGIMQTMRVCMLAIEKKIAPEKKSDVAQ